MPRPSKIFKKLFSSRDSKTQRDSSDNSEQPQPSYSEVPVPSAYHTLSGHTGGPLNSYYGATGFSSYGPSGTELTAQGTGSLPTEWTAKDDSAMQKSTIDMERKEMEHAEAQERKMALFDPPKAVIYSAKTGTVREVCQDMKISSTFDPKNEWGIPTGDNGEYKPKEDLNTLEYWHPHMVVKVTHKDGITLTRFFTEKVGERCSNGIAWHLQPPDGVGCVSCMSEHRRYDNLFNKVLRRQPWNGNKNPDAGMIDAAVDNENSNLDERRRLKVEDAATLDQDNWTNRDACRKAFDLLKRMSNPVGDLQ